MRTNDPSDITPIVPQRTMAHGSSVPTRAANVSQPSSATNAKSAANVVRGQLDRIYDKEELSRAHHESQTAQLAAVEVEPATVTAQQTAAPTGAQSAAADPDPTTHMDTADRSQQRAKQWNHYHSQWQNYYQQYYQRYYIGQVHSAKQQLERDAAAREASAETATMNRRPLTEDEAIEDLRSDLRKKISGRAKKVRKSKHFMPAVAALTVMLTFLFLQYNNLIFSYVNAYMSPGSISPANVIVEVNPNAKVGPDPVLIIPKINVEVPIVFDTTPDHASQMKAMNDGVAWFGIAGANSHPGQVGNTVLSGHSSNDILESGNYKFIFAKLDQLTEKDTFYINYEGKRYTYSVTRMEVVKPTEVNKLIYPTDKPVVTLITCTPLGTSLNRLLVTAEQISPSPSSASAAPTESESEDTPAISDGEIPGNTPSFFRNLFGGN